MPLITKLMLMIYNKEDIKMHTKTQRHGKQACRFSKKEKETNEIDTTSKTGTI